ncbi:hypothetical protein ABPG75_007305 [Micractinium tetrahymenae]
MAVSDLEGSVDDGAAQQRQEQQLDAPPSARHLADVPLWRVQWVALPGHQEVLIVHVPHYTSMFERLFRGPRPWRYGHLYLPEGSANLGAPEFALRPGSKAPLAGTLMEVLQACRLGDGRLVVLAVGVCRLRVARETLGMPYSRADVELLLDAEEQQAMEPLALQALESVQGRLGHSGSDDGDSSSSSSSSEALSLASLMQAVPAAAQEAAAAYSQCWVDYELSDARPEEDASAGVIDGTRPGDAQVLGRRLAQLGGNEVLALPFFDAVTSAVRADALAAAMDAAAAEEPACGGGGAGSSGGSSSSGSGSSGAEAGSSTSTGSALKAALLAQRPVLRQTDAAAYAQATSAAASSILRQLQLQTSSSGGAELGQVAAAGRAAAGAPPALNTAAERGVELQAPADVLEADALTGQPDSPALALQLEAAVWREIDAVQALAGKLRSRASPLPEGVQCLRPPSLPVGEAAAAAAAADEAAAAAAAAATQAEAAGEQQAPAKERPVAPPDYPALRRAQRLSFACAALLANVNAAEGRQAWVEAGSVCTRLRLGLAALRKHRQVLAAVVAVEGL